MLDSSRFRGHPGALIVDCDCVLLDWLSGFRTYASARLGRELCLSQNDNYDMSGWLGVSSEECTRLIMDFNEGDAGMFRALPPIEGAIEAVRTAKAAGREVHIITACSTNPAVIAMRRDNLTSVFGDAFTDIHCVGLRDSKQPLLEEYHAGTWVEDKFENAVLGAQAGHRSYLIRTTYNTHREPCGTAGLTWVDGWADIARLDI